MNYPREIRLVIERLGMHGFEGFLVGGALRDALLGREANDFDVTTSALPSEMQEVFADLRTIETGLKHGTITVLVDGMPIEVTTYRIDGEYLDARHPSEVVFTRNLREDLARRDFTVNAMAYSEKEGLVDLFGGKEDL
jgi:tRNA nucleotidyltransferase (CCA-adding enzyme)